jgi:hypothetical protein
LTPGRRRRAVGRLQERLRGFRAQAIRARACRVAGQHRSTQRKPARPPRAADERLATQLRAIAREHPRWGSQTSGEDPQATATGQRPGPASAGYPCQPVAIARCVLPVPGGPSRITFSRACRKSSWPRCSITCFLIERWKVRRGRLHWPRRRRLKWLHPALARVGEHFGPLAEGEIGGDDQRGALVAL